MSCLSWIKHAKSDKGNFQT